MDAKNLIDQLKALGLSQYRIAKDTGLSESTVSLISRGMRTGGLHRTVMSLQALLTMEKAKKAKEAKCQNTDASA